MLAVSQSGDREADMSLIHRIAISRNDRERQTVASEAIAAMDRYMIAGWNKSLRAEISRKGRALAPQEPGHDRR
jgi:hypothetical protein